MKPIFIILLALQGCWSTHVETQAFNSEVACHQYGEKAKRNATWLQDVDYQCESVESMISENKEAGFNAAN